MDFSHNISRRVSKTITEMTIGIIGILAIMLAQIDSKPNSYLDKHSSSQSIKLVSVISDDLTKQVMPTTDKINWINLLY